MAGFLYYLPRAQRVVDHDDLPQYGLGHVFETRGHLAHTTLTRGPDGDAGVLLGDDRHFGGDRRLAYVPDAQRWKRVPPVDGLDDDRRPWVGMYTDDPPTPEMLLRDHPLAGHYATLGDDRLWLIPVALGTPDLGAELPFSLVLPTKTGIDDDTGEWTRGDIRDEYRTLWQCALEAWEQIHYQLERLEATQQGKEIEAPSIKFTFSRENEVCMAALRANYRIGPIEAVMLDLLNDESRGAIMAVMVDLQQRMDWAKKKLEVAGSSTVAGAVDSPPITDPRSPTSGR